MELNRTIQILISTYNGENYIRQQLDSILKQDYPHIKVLIRDDGSSDATKDIIKEYVSKYDHFKAIYGKNVGVINSFFQLLLESNSGSDYFAFCDQDDIWLEPKISRAIEKLNNYDELQPLMYCSNKTLVDQDLVILKSQSESIIKPSFYNAIVENIATGCTTVINKETKNKILKNLPNYTIMHDWWIYLIASAFGQVYFDNDSYIYYRQHDSNVVGASSTFAGKWKTRFRTFLKTNKKKLIRRQIQGFYEIYSDEMIPQHRKEVEEFLNINDSFFKNLIYISKTKLFRQNWFDNLVFRTMILLKLV